MDEVPAFCSRFAPKRRLALSLSLKTVDSAHQVRNRESPFLSTNEAARPRPVSIPARSRTHHTSNPRLRLLRAMAHLMRVAPQCKPRSRQPGALPRHTLQGRKRAWCGEKRCRFGPWWPGVRTIESSRGRNKMQEQGHRKCTLIHPQIRPAIALKLKP